MLTKTLSTPALGIFNSISLCMGIALICGCGSDTTLGSSDEPSESDSITWVQRGQNLLGDGADDNFGAALALSSDASTLAVGALYNSDQGQVRVYGWNGDTWRQRGEDLVAEAPFDRFGQSVSLSADGSVLAVGGPANDAVGDRSGHVRVYVWSGSEWTQRGADIDGEGTLDESGFPVVLSADGSVVAIGARFNAGRGNRAGQVRVYDWSGAVWEQRGEDIDGEGPDDQFGSAVDLSEDGTVVAVGGILNDGSDSDAGHVRVYDWSETRWIQRGSDINGEAAGDQSGRSVSLSGEGSIVAVGAPFHSSAGVDAGHVRVYRWNGTTWEQRGSDLDGERPRDFFGFSASLSSDGSLIAVGSHGSNRSATDAGHVTVYSWSSSEWSQIGPDVEGEQANDSAGNPVALSPDGSAVAIGAQGNDAAASNAGQVRVYVKAAPRDRTSDFIRH